MCQPHLCPLSFQLHPSSLSSPPSAPMWLCTFLDVNGCLFGRWLLCVCALVTAETTTTLLLLDLTVYSGGWFESSFLRSVGWLVADECVCMRAEGRCLLSPSHSINLTPHQPSIRTIVEANCKHNNSSGDDDDDEGGEGNARGP